MYMTLAYKSLGTGPDGPFRPTALNLKTCGIYGPEFTHVDWDPVEIIRVDDETSMIAADVRVNNASGLMACIMQGGRFLSCMSDGAVELSSLKFSQSPGTPGFSIDGLPIVTTGLSPEREYIREYFDRNGLFVQSAENAGGSHALWFYPDVTWEHIQRFLTAHPWNGLGSFAHVLQFDHEGRIKQRLGYLYAHPEHAESDLSRWKSDDIQAGGIANG